MDERTRPDDGGDTTQRERPPPSWEVRDHAFAPLTFRDAAGGNPIETDWCGYLYNPDALCGLHAGIHERTHTDPDDRRGGDE